MTSLYECFNESKGICTDSREMRSGQIFFALKGDNFNGHHFVFEALNNGASAVVIDELVDGVDIDDSRIFFVTNVLIHLQNIATYHRKKWGKNIISITGSNGKTTVKELIFKVLSQKYSTYATPGNFNNHLGVPLTLLGIKSNHDIAIVEMGASHLGEIRRLSEISLPNYGYITNFGLAHLEGFGGAEGVIKGKSELYKYLEETGGLSFVDLSDPVAEKNCNSSHVNFSSNISFFQKSEYLGVAFGDETIMTHLTGSYQQNNIKAAITIGRHFNIEDNKIAYSLANYIPDNNRGELFHLKSNRIFLDAYNANPSSMEASLKNAVKLNQDLPHLYIAGGLLELGEFSKEQHQKMIEVFIELGIKNAWFIGEQFMDTSKPKIYKFFRDTFEASQAIKTQEIENHFIWIKGSRRFALETLLKDL